MSYTVTRSGNGHVFQLYRGRLRSRAEDAYDRAKPEAGTVVTLTKHTVPPVVLRKSDDVVVNTCSTCHRPIYGDLVPAKDAFTGQDRCDDCVRAERHARRSA